MKKRIKVLVLLVIIMVLIAGCRGTDKDTEKIPEKGHIDYNEDNSAEVIEMSKEINKILYTTVDIDDMKEKIDSYSDKIGEQTYMNHFNLASRVIAAKYYMDFGVDTYDILELIEKDKGEFKDIYIAFKVTGSGEGEYEDAGMVTYEVKGLNKYTYQSGKLVNFKSILD